MGDNFDVNDIKSLENAAYNLKYYFNVYSDTEKYINTNMHILVEQINKLLNPYTTLYNNEEYNPFDSLSSVLKSIDGNDLSDLTNIHVYNFSVNFINAVLMKAKFLLATKVLDNATVKGDDYLSKFFNLFNELVNDTKYMSSWVTFYENEVNTSESKLRTITDHIEKSVSTTYILADETSDVYNEYDEYDEDGQIEQPILEPSILEPPMLQKPMPAPAPTKKSKTSYLSSFLQSMTRKGKKKGGMATRKKKYRRRYKKQIKRRTKKTRSTH
jgi:hypothetical protein